MQFKDFFQKEKLKAWFVTHADSRRATVALGIIAFFEAIFFPIPPDFFLMAILAANGGRRWAYYSLVTSIFSVAGGLVTFGIGYLFFDTLGGRIIELYHFGPWFESTKALFQHHAFWSVLVAAITPIPDKLFNLFAGFFKINFLVFTAAYIVARFARFFLVGFLMKVFGVRVARIIYRHLSIFLYALLAGIVIALVVIALK